MRKRDAGMKAAQVRGLPPAHRRRIAAYVHSAGNHIDSISPKRDRGDAAHRRSATQRRSRRIETVPDSVSWSLLRVPDSASSGTILSGARNHATASASANSLNMFYLSREDRFAVYLRGNHSRETSASNFQKICGSWAQILKSLSVRGSFPKKESQPNSPLRPYPACCPARALKEEITRNKERLLCSSFLTLQLRDCGGHRPPLQRRRIRCAKLTV